MFTCRQILLCGLVYWLAEANLPFFTLWTLQKPLVCGWIAGLLLGAPEAGAVCGALLSVILLGFSSAGSSMPADLSLAGITGAALTAAGWSPLAAVLPALLAGAAGRYIWKLRMHVNVFFARRVMIMLEDGKTTEILLPSVLLPALFALALCLPACAAVIRVCDLMLRPDLPEPGLVRNLFPGLHGILRAEHAVPAAVRSLSAGDGILAAAAGLLPAGGLALALSAAFHGIRKERYNPQEHSQSSEDPPDPDDEDLFADPDEDIPQGDSDAAEPDGGTFFTDPDEVGRIGKKPRADESIPQGTMPGRHLPRHTLLEAALLWLLFLHICYNNEWMMGQAMALTFLPLARKLRPGDGPGQREILLRQSRYFNTHCECGACIPGLMASMEERLTALDEAVDMPEERARRTEEILMVRSSLMGVCGALGDTLFQKHLIPVLLLSASLLTVVLPGYPAGPVLYAAAMTALSFVIGLRSFFDGYKNTPEQQLLKLEKNVFRRAEAVMRILLGLLACPAAILFTRLPVPGMYPPEPHPVSFADGMAGGIAGIASALALTAASLYCIRKYHWKSRRLYLVLMLAGAAFYIVCRLLT